MDSFLLDEYLESVDILHDSQHNSESFSSLSPYDTHFSNFNYEYHEKFNILDPGILSESPNLVSDNLAVNSGVNPDGWVDEMLALDDFPDDCLKFITEILMEEDLDGQTGSLQDYTALQDTEKSLLDALGVTSASSSGEYPPLYGQNVENPAENHATDGNMVNNVSSYSISNSMSYGSSDGFNGAVNGQGYSPASTLLDSEPGVDWFKEACNENSGTPLVENGARGRKNTSRDDDDADFEGGRKNKHLASYDDEYVVMEQFDDVLLCNEGEDRCSDSGSQSSHRDKRGSTKKKARSKKKAEEVGQVVDLRGLLTQCGQAVASFDLRNANELLAKIKVHSSQYGDSTERLAYYFGNALEARLAGTGWQKYKDEISKRVPSSDILKAYRTYVSAIPFRRTSYHVANDAINKLAMDATKIHIIDFGIFFGFQWPGLIQKLAKRKSGPPVLRITGIDYPERGFRPAKRVEETGRRLAGYCERFGVPFEYRAIAKNWQDVTLEELNTESDEAVVVNCLYMSRKLLDETVDESNPRDTFFKLIRKLNPSLFIHGIVNGIFSGPFFETRFREALFHYSSIFDIFESTIPRESNERLLVESHLYGTDALNVIACEGIERIERPETYRQWQCRIEGAGFRKLVLEDAVINRVQAAMKNYHKDFVVNKNNDWLLQGWKGRILYALSCWRSA